MTAAPPLASIPVSVVVERTKGMDQWTDYHWKPVEVLAGQPAAQPWTLLSGDAERARFFAGNAAIELHRTETPNYRENLETGHPQLWVGLRPTGGEPAYELFAVTADPAEGEALTEAGNDLIEAVLMPDSIRDAVAAFIAENKYERVFIKRKRERADPNALGRRAPAREDSQ